jgi:hypothetical protein
LGREDLVHHVAAAPPRRRTALAAACLAALAAALSPALSAAAAPPGAASGTALAEAPYLAEADLIDGQAPQHLFWGQALGVFVDSAGSVVGTSGHGDSAIWTGHYLASQAFRYAVARDHVRGQQGNNQGQHADGDQRLWRQRMLDAKARIVDAAGGLHRLVTIAQYWKGGSPSASGGCTDRYPPPSAGTCPTVGGAFQGEAGLLMRFCAPAGTPPYIFGNQGNGVTPGIPWEDGQTWYCKAQISRDQYMGAMLGLLAAFDMAGPDDAALQAQLEHDITAMTGYLVRHGWSTLYPNGDVVYPDLSQGFANPLFVINPLERLHMVQGARHAAAVAGTPQDRLFWEGVWREELATQWPELHVEYMLAIAEPKDHYYKFNLDYASNFDVIRLEQDPATRLLLKQAFSELDASMADDRNAHFEAVTYALTGDRRRVDQAVRDTIDWIAYRNRTASSVHNSDRCGKDLQCVPADYVQIDQSTPAGTAQVATQNSSTLRSLTPLPVNQRPASDFIWQRDPYTLDGAWSSNEIEPGIDYLLPYWMIRYYTEVSPAAPEPLPPWPGPTGGNANPGATGVTLPVPQSSNIADCVTYITRGSTAWCTAIIDKIVAGVPAIAAAP